MGRKSNLESARLLFRIESASKESKVLLNCPNIFHYSYTVSMTIHLGLRVRPPHRLSKKFNVAETICNNKVTALKHYRFAPMPKLD